MMKSSEPMPDDLPKISRKTLTIVAGSLVLAMAAFFILGFWRRHERIQEREAMARDIRDQKLVVQVVRPKTTQKSVELTLPADIRAYATTALYARTDGYLASWKVDIGDRVKKGDLLAVIAAPDTDADLEQAEAALNQQRTNYHLAVATDERWRGLIATRGVTQQQLDQFHSTREQAKANVGSAAAGVDRLKALVGFERITAPFDGVVTARTYDVGSLISAANIGPGQELFDVAEDDRLRVFVNVPQEYSLLIKFNQPVELALERNYPGHKFQGRVERSAGTLDPVTRTLRTELDFKNDDPAGRIFPGMYGQAIFTIQRDRPVLTVPTAALLFEADGKQVAVVTPDNQVHFQKIALGNDYGTEIEVISGLQGDERVIANPGEQLAEGVEVSPVAEENDGAPAGNGAQSASTKPDRQ
jgi:RND family efflux transporter MFP subunit